MQNITIVGDGAMSAVCASLLCEKGFAVKMWGYDAVQLAQIAAAHENIKFLPGYKLPQSLQYEPDDSAIFKNADVVISAVPCQFMRGVWQRLKKYFNSDIPIVSVTKGIENHTLLRPSEILQDVLGDVKICVLSGPTIADELMRRLPATATAASENEKLACLVQEIFTTPWFRVYTNADVRGVELAGAMKNVIAIAAGIIDGVNAGNNTKAALLARGLAEITRLGVALGADVHTFAGLSGLGDLVTTCISPAGRNRSFGERIGKGITAEQALAATASVVEGVATCTSVIELAGKYNVDMPITQAVYSVLFRGVSVRQAIQNLMMRTPKPERVL